MKGVLNIPISTNAYLSQTDMEVNAHYIFDYFKSKGWTETAICGMLGNMQSESTLNFGIWESLQANNMQGGYGIVQWTPATKYTNWADSKGYQWGAADAQLERIQYEMENNLQWGATSQFPMSFRQYSQSNDSAGSLALAFLANYEKPANPVQPIRSVQAEQWYTLLHGSTPTPQPTNKKKTPIWVFLRRVG